MKTPKLATLAAGFWLGGFLLTGEVSVLAADSEANLSKTFTVTPGGSLVVEADRGSIEIQTAGDDKVVVQVIRKVTGAGDKKAREMLDTHEVTFAQDGDKVTVRARSTKQWSNWSLWGGGLQVRYEIKVPRKFNLDLKTAGGSISVPDLKGEAKAVTAGGSLKFQNIEGAVTARTSGGSISVASATGAVDAHTSGGSIEVGEARAAAKLGTSGGSIRVKVAASSIEANTSGGSIDIGAARGAVTASTSGGNVAAALAASPVEDCKLSTSGGSVRLKVPDGINAELDAKTSGGRVNCEVPVTVQGEIKRSQVVGKLGNGGKLVRLRTSGGNITVEKQ
jgi:hypothetical protein